MDFFSLSQGREEDLQLSYCHRLAVESLDSSKIHIDFITFIGSNFILTKTAKLEDRR